MKKSVSKDRRRTRGDGSAKLTLAHLWVIRRNISRMEAHDHWPLASLLQARIWNSLDSSWDRCIKARRDLGRDFCTLVKGGQIQEVEAVPGTRAPILWRLR